MPINSVRILEPCTTQCKQITPLSVLDNLSTQTVYLAAPKSIYPSRRYRRATKIIELCHADADILLPHLLWTDNDDWRDTFQAVLRPVTTLYVLADADGFVGRGVWTEVEYLFSNPSRTWRLQSYALTATFDVTEHWCLTRWESGADWCRYAVLIAPLTRRRIMPQSNALDTLAPPSHHEAGCHG